METHAALVDITRVACHADALGSYHAELTSDLLDEQGQLLDEVIAFAFETLGVRHLDVRVLPADHCRIYSFCIRPPRDLLAGRSS